MKKKKGSLRKFTPMPAAAAVLALASSGAYAQFTPLFNATFPASWNGTGTTVTNESSGAGVGFQSGTATYTTSTVPPGAAAGTGSMALAGAGGIKVTPTESLNNTAIAADGGFTYNIDFLWDGTDSTVFTHVEKLISYAGTEDLQLDTTAANGSAILEMEFAADGGAESTAVSTTINKNTWYNVTLTFDTAGNSLVGGDISGIADLYVNGALVSTGAATKGTYGDGLNRPIGIGEWGYGHTTSTGGLHGDIYNASVDLGVAPVPEPSSLVLGALGGFGLLGMTWKTRRRKS